ncbi:SDR family oxidoreductase [Microbacterium terricola]|uniref:SDR family oxidoreductase n=1 Tax=Microbacterium terricola TaxID=344163 RepID=UPI0021E80FE4|nr:SDR family oxidoreductase [Microbacterium terricola]UYK40634.1 SDR family oxidoreductase [Microbacterium terricola]
MTLPDLAGSHALVTGASDGIGRQIALGLARAGADLILPVRNREKGERAVASIRASIPDAGIQLCDLDLSRLGSVRDLAEQLRDGPTIDVFVANAGIVSLGDPTRHVSEDGFELHFQTNFLGHFVLTLALLPVLANSRVVVQCSYAARFARIDWDDLQSEHRYSAMRAYAMSKLALGLFAYELSRRSAANGWGARVSVCHPGIAPDTGIGPLIRERASDGTLAALARRLGNTPAEAAQPALLAVAMDAGGCEFYGPSGPPGFSGPARNRRPYRHLTDRAAATRMWERAEEFTVA